MVKAKQQTPSRDEAAPAPSQVVLSRSDAKHQELLRQRVDRLPRAGKAKPGREPKRLWSADPTLQDEIVAFALQQRAKHRTRAEIAQALGVNPTMLTRLQTEREEARSAQLVAVEAGPPRGGALEARPQRSDRETSTALVAPAMRLTLATQDEAPAQQESGSIQHVKVPDRVPLASSGMTYFIAENDVVRHAVSGMRIQDVKDLIDHLISKRIISPVG